MTTFRSEDTLVGIIGIGVFVWTLWTLKRGWKLGRLPIGRSYVRRDERAAAFNMLFLLYLGAAVLVAFIAADLLFGFDRIWS
jgi:hypothetical protein